MSIQKECKPNLSSSQVCDITKRLYGLSVSTVRPLPSYDDQNFHVIAEGEKFVLKIMNSMDSQNMDLLELQTYSMDFLHQNGLPVQTTIRTIGGNLMSLEQIDCGFGEQKYLVRLLTYLPGIPMAKITYTPELLYQTGRMAANMDQVLLQLEHENLRLFQRGNFIWNLFNVPLLELHMHVLDGDPIQSIVKGVINQYREHVLPKLNSFHKGVNHGDLNDHNILVVSDGGSGYRISGILDFGDMSSGCLVFDLAIVITYMMIESPCPLEMGGPVLAGWESVFPLNADERDALYLLVLSRFCQSVVCAHNAVIEQPENYDYLMISAKKGAKLLQMLWERGKEDIQNMWFQHAAQMSAIKQEQR